MATIVLSEDLRTMRIPTTEKILGCVGDKNVRRVHFQMSRYCDETDLSSYHIRVHYINAAEEGNYNEVSDVVIDESNITFVWTVDRLACKKEGVVQVNVVLANTTDQALINRFNSGIGKFKVKPAFIEDPYGDIAVTDDDYCLVFVVAEQESE